ncbi:MAG: GNAT family protein [Actinomycetota bacterium]|nr:GNAT family protein [Actinomycetota bacterium]
MELSTALFAPSRGTPRQSVPHVPLCGRRVRLRALAPSDYDFCYQLAVDERTAPHWRYRGAPPRPEDFVRELWQSVLVQFIVERRDGSERLGLVTAYDANTRDGHCHIAAIFRPDTRMWPLEGVFLFVNYLFAEYDFRKLYGEVIEYNLPAFASTVGRWLDSEGVRREHEYHSGRYWDVHLLALWRDRFELDRERMLRRITKDLPA